MKRSGRSNTPPDQKHIVLRCLDQFRDRLGIPRHPRYTLSTPLEPVKATLIYTFEGAPPTPEMDLVQFDKWVDEVDDHRLRPSPTNKQPNKKFKSSMTISA